MGLLDKRDRVIDFILTERGRKLYASGELDFAYFSVLDDGLDYDPVGATSDDDRDVQVRALPMWESPFVRDVRDSTAPFEPTSHLFSAAPGYDLVPFVSSPVTGTTVSLMCDQVQDGTSYRRSGTGVVQIDLGLSGEAEGVDPGFTVRFFSSGSNGLTEIFPRRDLAGRRALDPFIAVAVDSEHADAPSAGDPTSVRQPNDATGPDLRTSLRRPG